MIKQILAIYPRANVSEKSFLTAVITSLFYRRQILRSMRAYGVHKVAHMVCNKSRVTVFRKSATTNIYQHF